jgi:hypothetical protein
MATQPPFNWRVPLDTDRPAGARQIRELAEDIAATIVAGRKTSGAYAVAQGTLSAGVAGQNSVNLGTVVESAGTPAWTLSGGALLAPLTGVYLLVYFARIDQSQSQVWVGPSSAEFTNIAVSGGVPSIAAPALEKTVVRTRTAGQAFEKPQVYTAPNVGSTGVVRLIATYLGNPS